MYTSSMVGTDLQVMNDATNCGVGVVAHYSISRDGIVVAVVEYNYTLQYSSIRVPVMHRRVCCPPIIITI